MEKEAEILNARVSGKPAEEILEWATNYFGAENIALASSFGAEDQVLSDMLLKAGKGVIIFTLDTGRLPQETYDVIEETRKRYGIPIEILFPDNRSVEDMLKKYGPDLFYESADNRKLCCRVRKVEPLKKKLSTLKAWICGMRREQSVTRSEVRKIEWDETFKLYKINPLAEWTEKQVWDYIRKNGVPYNKLHDRGYPSIGCKPCTRAVKPGEDIRAGRWWWEEPGQKECGLHVKNGKIAPGRKP